MTDERKKLTLSLKTPGIASNSTGGIKIERRRKIFKPGESVVSTATTSPSSASAQRLKSILDQAKKTENSKINFSELDVKRRTLIEEEDKKNEARQKVRQEAIAATTPEEVAPSRDSKKTFRKDTDEPKTAFSKEPQQPKSSKMQENFGKRKITVNDIYTESSDSDDGDIVVKERRRSIASFQRKLERQRQKSAEAAAAATLKPVIKEVEIPDFISVKDLANRMSVQSANLVKKLMEMGVMATINQIIDADTAQIIVEEFGHKFKRVGEEETIEGNLKTEDSQEHLLARPPVVTIMGHVDHGKTTLLDALRETDVVSTEAGGITQHIGSYQIETKNGKKITFIDTPGHAAFSAMRARGANITDIVILVVAANDGIMPQTIEAISHAKSAGVPIIVAINKIDLPEANPTKVKSELLTHGLVTEEFGGDILTVEISAKNKTNLEKLEELVLLQAEILDLKANPNRSAEGVVVESEIEKGLGSTATVLIQKGTLKAGDIFVSGRQWGKVRALIDSLRKRISQAVPALPVVVLGWTGSPQAGDDFVVVESEAKAREIASYREKKYKEQLLAVKTKSMMDQLMSGVKDGDVKKLPLLIKADVNGSVEAIVSSINEIKSDKVKTDIVLSGVGGINESDITLAKTTGALVVGFNVRATNQAKEVAKQEGIDIRYYSVIYNLLDDVKMAMEGLLTPETRENIIGTADVLQVFTVGKGTKVAGCRVADGMIKRSAKIRLIRDNVVLYQGDIGQMKFGTEDVKERKAGQEMGISFEKYNDIQVGDKIECFEQEQIKSEL
jgi:translation initiation factor IF-2